ncbi:hypothetical protein Tco_1563213 [Tanacetum coccineum]
MLFDKEMKRLNTFVDMDTELVKASETRTEGSSKRAGEELESENLKKQKLDENMLQNINKEDLETLWKLVKANHGKWSVEESYRTQSDWFEAIFSSGVTFVEISELPISYAGRKRISTLTPLSITKNEPHKKLQADYWNEMGYQLLKLMKKQLRNPGNEPLPPLSKLSEAKPIGLMTTTLISVSTILDVTFAVALLMKPLTVLRRPPLTTGNQVLLINSGCSRYMKGVKQYQHRYSKESGLKLVFGDNSPGDTEGYGSVNCNGNTFMRVAYVNDLKHNLIIISQLCDVNFKVLFTKTQGTILNKYNEVVLISLRRRDVYVINMSSYNQESNTCFFAKASHSVNWL